MKAGLPSGATPALLPRAQTQTNTERTRVAPRGSDPLLLGAIALAIALRVWHLRHGLPDFVEEAVPFRQAVSMWAGKSGIDWNPHFFRYPSLTLYLHLLIQQLHYFAGRVLGAFHNSADYLLSLQIDPTPMVVPARLLGVVADAILVLTVWRIGERLRRGAGALAAFLTACAPTLILSSRSIFTDTVMAALMVAALERMLAYLDLGGRARLITAVALVGLAAGAKYPAGLLVIPLGAVLAMRHRGRGLPIWVAASAAAFAVFVLTTPFALVDLKTFQRDFAFVGRITVAGQLGNIERSGFLFHLGNLARDLGWVGAALLPVSLLLSLARARAHRGAIALWVALLAIGLPISLARIEAERYLIPVIPLAAALAAAAAFELAGLLPRRARAPGLALVVAALAAPALTTAIRTAGSGGVTTQIEARRWCEGHLTGDSLLVQEAYGATLVTRLAAYELEASPLFRSASPAVQARYRALRQYSSVTLPLAVVGRAVNVVRPPGRPPVGLEVVPHAADLNQACYDPRLFQGVDFVLTSGAVRGRFEADPLRYAAQNRFYALLDSAAVVAVRLPPHGNVSGPEIVVYRLGPRARAAVAARGPLDPLWWAEFIPRAYRDRADVLLLPPGESSGGALRQADGTASAWVRSLDLVYATRFMPFALHMAVELRAHGRLDPARRFAASILESRPGEVGACLIFSDCSKRLGDWRGARAAIERAIVASGPAEPSPLLRLERAEVLDHLGERAGAREELERVAASSDPALAEEARRRLAQPGQTSTLGRRREP